MGKRFSIVTVNDEDLFISGYVLPPDLSKSDLFVELLCDVSVFNTVNVEINHCLFLDYPGKDTDISSEDLELLLDRFDSLVEQEHIFSEEVLSFDTRGLFEEELIEERI